MRRAVLARVRSGDTWNTCYERFGGTLPLQSPKLKLINTFINDSPLAETEREVKKVKSWPC